MVQIPLSELPNCEKAVVKYFLAGLGLENKLYSMGLMPGKEVFRVSGNPFRGPIVVDVMRTRLGLGYGMANKIIVEYQNGTKQKF